MALIKCNECGAEISDKAATCPHCGAPVEIKLTEKENEVNFTIPKYNFFSSLVRYIFGTITLASIGIVLTLTGLGAIIGIPFIIVAAFMLLFGPIFWPTLIGECPYCGTKFITASYSKAGKCKVCKNRILIKDKKFYKMPVVKK